MTKAGWFQVDAKGLADTVEFPSRLPLELVQNAFDEKSTRISVTLVPVEGKRALAELVVTDDNPEGFIDLSQSYVLYAPSKKRDDPTKRGRMNVGEKRVISCCRSASIASTTGTIYFDEDGSRRRTSERIESGTVFRGFIRLRAPEQQEALDFLRQVIVPEHMTLTVNGEEVPHRPVVLTIDNVTLPTVLPDEDGRLSRKTRRRTTLRLYDPLPGETAHIFEMGIPVVEHDCRWHVDVGQRVPLNTERDNVSPSYLREIRTAVLNVSHQLITPADAKSVWVKDALPAATPAALNSVLDQMFGPKRASYDPSCPEANKQALNHGYTLVHGNQFSSCEWDAIRRAGALTPAGRYQELRGDVQTSPDGKPPIPEEKWTPGMRRVADYAKALALELTGTDIEVSIYNVFGARWSGACWSNGDLSLNVGTLGHKWFDHPDIKVIDALLIHEFAHHKAKDHMTDAFHDECCRLGAALRHCSTRISEGA